jgi:cytochrome c556
MINPVRNLSHRGVRSGLACLLIAAGVVAGTPFHAMGQKADPSNTGVTRTDDLILARQLLFDMNESAMMPIDRAAGGADLDLGLLKAQAYTIYTVLSVAPHLFPSSTKPVFDKDGVPAPSTAASPKIWDDFDAFYDQMTDAANVAYDASQAADIGKFRPLAMQLRMACDSCHDKHMQVYDPTAKR